MRSDTCSKQIDHGWQLINKLDINPIYILEMDGKLKKKQR